VLTLQYNAALFIGSVFPSADEVSVLLPQVESFGSFRSRSASRGNWDFLEILPETNNALLPPLSAQ
jgi:hypothetical protein